MKKSVYVLLMWCCLYVHGFYAQNMIVNLPLDASREELISKSKLIFTDNQYDQNRCGVENTVLTTNQQVGYLDSNSNFYQQEYKELSVSVWLHYQKSDTSSIFVLGQWGQNRSNQKYKITIEKGHVAWWVTDGEKNIKRIITTKKLYDEIWYHVVCSVTKNGLMLVYINGKKQAEGFRETVLLNQKNTITLKVGGLEADKKENFIGKLDNIKLFDKPLPLQDISKLYNKEKNEGCPTYHTFNGTIFDRLTKNQMGSEVTIIDEKGKHVAYSFNYHSFNFNIEEGKKYFLILHEKGYHDFFDTIIGTAYKTRKSYYLMRADSLIVLKNISFLRGKSTLSLSSHTELEKVTKMLKENKNLKIEVRGHTDNIGSAEANLQLSQKRAEEVRKYLVEQGIVSTRVEAVGLGGSQPISSNRTELSRRKNRRVEIKIKAF